MTFAKMADFARHIKKDPLCHIYLLYGSQAYLKGLYTRQLCQKAVGGGFADFNLHKLSGKGLKMDELADAAMALPLMGETSCVVVSDLEVEKLAAGELEKLKSLLKDPPESCVLILVMMDVDFNVKKSAKCKAVQKLVEENGAVADLSAPAPADLFKFASARAEKNGSSLSKDVFQRLVERCSNDMQLLTGEIDKLSAYASGREITVEDVDLCCSAVIESNVFELSKAILRGDMEAAMGILSDLFYLREQPVAIVGAMAMSFVDIYRAKLAAQAGRSASDVASAFDYKGREFRIRNAMREASNCSLDYLKDAIRLLAAADQQLKSSRVDDRVLMEELLVRLFLSKAHSAAATAAERGGRR